MSPQYKIPTEEETVELADGACCPLHAGKATGAWGRSPFQSEHDYGIVEEFDIEAGLVDLEKAIEGPEYNAPPPVPIGHSWLYLQLENGRAIYYGQQASNYLMASVASKEKQKINYSMYAPFCSDVPTVREHLNSGPLTKMLADYEEKMLLPHLPKNYPPHRAGLGYDFVLLVACAMTLGCTIPDHYKDVVRKVYKSVGLMRDALTQVDWALNGCEKYKDKGVKQYTDGEPYEFGHPLFPLELFTTLCMTGFAEEHTNPNGTNVVSVNKPSPGTNHAKIEFTEGLNELKAKFAESRYSADVCAGCGSMDGKDGSLLLGCGGCRKRKYCSKHCQKQHWKTGHKKFCKKASSGDGGNFKPGTEATESAAEDGVVKAPTNTVVEDAD